MIETQVIKINKNTEYTKAWPLAEISSKDSAVWENSEKSKGAV